jgi:uncharacterized membrane protein YGL010W
MPEDKRSDDVEKFLSEQKAFEDRKQALIDDLLRQRAEAMNVFDERLAKLGYKAQAGKSKKSHHKTQTPAPEAAAKPKAKA